MAGLWDRCPAKMRAWFLMFSWLLTSPMASATSVSQPGTDAGLALAASPGEGAARLGWDPERLRRAPSHSIRSTEVSLPEDAESLERYEAKSLFMLKLSLMGLAPSPPSGPSWVAFSVGAEPSASLRVWARIAPGTTSFVLTAPSLLGVTPEVVLEASGEFRSAVLDPGLQPPTLAEPEPVPEPGTGLLLGLGLLGLRRSLHVR